MEEARQRCWFVDSKGLVVKGRSDLTGRNSVMPMTTNSRGFAGGGGGAEAHGHYWGFREAGIIPRPILEAMARLNERPIIFSLSNPTSKTECTVAEAYSWTGGRAIFASGSPFDPVILEGKTLVPAQGNNVYIFPGWGWG